MNTPRSIKRLGASLLIGGQAVAATLRGRINRGELFEQMLEAGPGSLLTVSYTHLTLPTISWG